jgi:hypothetical protein
MNDELPDDVFVPVAGVPEQDLQALGDSVLAWTLRRAARNRTGGGRPAADETIASFQDSL